jgi:hypothetical protein
MFVDTVVGFKVRELEKAFCVPLSVQCGINDDVYYARSRRLEGTLLVSM